MIPVAISDLGWSTAALLAIAIAISAVYQRRRDRNLITQAEAHMSGRPRRSRAEFAESFYPVEMRDVATRVVKVLDEMLPVDLSQVEPPDRIEEDLKLGSLDSLLLLDLLLRLEREFGVKFDKDSRRAIADVRNIDDLIKMIAKALERITQKVNYTARKSSKR
jgi:acyl carrier protein